MAVYNATPLCVPDDTGSTLPTLPVNALVKRLQPNRDRLPILQTHHIALVQIGGVKLHL